MLNTFVLVAIEPKKPLKRPAQSKTKQEVGCKCHARIMPVDSARAKRRKRKDRSKKLQTCTYTCAVFNRPKKALKREHRPRSSLERRQHPPPNLRSKISRESFPRICARGLVSKQRSSTDWRREMESSSEGARPRARRKEEKERKKGTEDAQRELQQPRQILQRLLRTS